MEVFEAYEKRGESFSYAACIYPTAPFVTAHKLAEGMRILSEARGTMLMPVVAFSFPPQRGVIKRGERLQFLNPECRNMRSQDLETIYHDCGQFYCYDVEKFRREKGQIDSGILPYIVSELEVQDIDNETDWQLAEMKYQMMKKRDEQR